MEQFNRLLLTSNKKDEEYFTNVLVKVDDFFRDRKNKIENFSENDKKLLYDEYPDISHEQMNIYLNNFKTFSVISFEEENEKIKSSIKNIIRKNNPFPNVRNQEEHDKLIYSYELSKEETDNLVDRNYEIKDNNLKVIGQLQYDNSSIRKFYKDDIILFTVETKYYTIPIYPAQYMEVYMTQKIIKDENNSVIFNETYELNL
jgi:hypothetical protein